MPRFPNVPSSMNPSLMVRGPAMPQELPSLDSNLLPPVLPAHLTFDLFCQFAEAG